MILDGAFGNMAQRMPLTVADFTVDGIEARGCYEALCLTRPDIVKDIHLRYLRAGADIITTNSFCANAIDLAASGLAHRAADIAFAAARIARSAADEYALEARRKCIVAGSIGPTGHPLSSPAPGAPGIAVMRQAFTTQTEALMRGGADLILIETVYDLLNAETALEAVSKVDSGIPVIISATVSTPTGCLHSGHDIEAFCSMAKKARAVAVCLNCGTSPAMMLPLMRTLARNAPCTVGYYPSAGLPDANGLYADTPRQWAEKMRPILEEGLADIVGGCCGTTPAHIRALASMVRNTRPRKSDKNE